MKVDAGKEERLKTSLELAMKHGNNVIRVYDYEADSYAYFSRNLMCPSSGIAYPNPEPNNFSFNSPKGACPTCKGLGERAIADVTKIVPKTDSTLKGGAIATMKDKKEHMVNSTNSWYFY